VGARSKRLIVRLSVSPVGRSRFFRIKRETAQPIDLKLCIPPV
jgi:hypothetical protein